VPVIDPPSRASATTRAEKLARLVLVLLSLLVIVAPTFRSSVVLAVMIAALCMFVAGTEIHRSWRRGWLNLTLAELHRRRIGPGPWAAPLCVALGVVATMLMQWV
jgi:hypothetical protein